MSVASAIEVPPSQRVVVHRQQPAADDLLDVGAAVREALEHPYQFPALRRALTPDDHVVILVDDVLPQAPVVLTAVLEHLVGAHISTDAITLLCLEATSTASWIEQLPAAFRHLKVERHDPHNRKKLAYLATTKHGRRVYLNRTAVDADQLVVVARRGFGPLLGQTGAEGEIFPAFSDAETQQAEQAHLSMAIPGGKPWPVQAEATEIAWLMGAPFFVHLIEGSSEGEGEGEGVAHVVAGAAAIATESQRLLEARWRVEVDEEADVVIAEVSGNRSTFAELARAAACASRAVKPDGRIVVVCECEPRLSETDALLRQADTPDDLLALLKKRHALDGGAAFQWAHVAQRAKLFVQSRLPADLVEELFATPLENGEQTRRVIGEGRCLYLPDANRSLVVVR